MEENWKEPRWIPMLIFISGTLLSVSIWFILFYNIDDYIEKTLPSVDAYFAWIMLILCESFTILVSLIVRFADLSRKRAHHLALVNQDLTREIEERLNAEKARQTMEAAMMQGQKLQAMGTLAGGIAHDFNNLLYAIIGYVEMARDDLPVDSKVHQNLGKVLDASHRGQDLVSRILTFSRKQQHQFDPIDLKETIEAVLSLLRPTIPASVEIVCHLNFDCKILGNKTKIHQVLVNLITNAVDAMDGEGEVQIDGQMLEQGDTDLTARPKLKSRRYCKLTVKDTGHGIEADKLNRIFEPFYTTKEVGKGTGLGLSIVHAIVEEHDGDISVTSQLGHGTCFVILLPEMDDAVS